MDLSVQYYWSISLSSYRLAFDAPDRSEWLSDPDQAWTAFGEMILKRLLVPRTLLRNYRQP